MNEYDIGKAFAAIEEELIASMMRNMQYHRDWEDAEGFNWSMWQAEQLKALNKYKKANKKKFQRQFNEVNGSIGQVIKQARKQGNMEQELEILEAIKNGWKAPKKLNKSVQTSAEFFKLNTRKLEALIKATEHDFKKAEVAMLRRANDQYRQVIFNAQVYANTGAGTYEKAVDMATKDFLAAGINCIEYANGARHTMQDYADMAIRTAVKRAYLTGEGEKRQEWGISTVIINKRGNPCPKCLPFVGKIMIDDVWSGGKASGGQYPLISSAISAGLYHPRCRDSHTTYFEGISTSEKLTKKDVVAAEKGQRALQQDKYVERQAEKYGRLETYSLDSENKETYGKKSAALTQRRVERMRARKNSVGTYREMRMQRDTLKSETAALEERRKAYELDFMESSDMDAARKAKEAKALIEAKNAEIADLTEKITAMQELKAKAAEEHLVSNGIAKRVKLSKAMSVEAIDEIQTVLDDLVKKRGLPPLEAIEYNPAKTMSAAAQYNWQDKTMYLGGRTKDGLKFEKERLDTEKKFHEIREKRGNVSYAEQYLQEAKEELRQAKTKEERHFAQRKIDHLQSELNLTQKNAARSIGDVVIHEYGHHLHNLVSEQTKPAKKKQWLFGQKELGAQYISGKWMHNPNSYKARLLSSQVSEYATESPLEAFAESFNAYIRGDKIPDELKSLMDEAVEIAGRAGENAARAKLPSQVLRYDPDGDFTVKLKDYSDDINQAISEACKHSAETGGSREYLTLIDSKTGKRVYEELGEQALVGGTDFYNFLKEHDSGSYIFVHSHALDSSLSFDDLKTLLRRKEIEGMVAARNDGIVYAATLEPRKVIEAEALEQAIKEQTELLKKQGKDVRMNQSLLYGNAADTLIERYAKEYYTNES